MRRVDNLDVILNPPVYRFIYHHWQNVASTYH